MVVTVGLRERNAAHTRELLLNSALDLFVEQGYEATRMEEVAERADVGVSTLYRYFPTKDRLVVDPLALHGQMAAELRARPAEESLELALGRALTVLINTPRPESRRLRQLVSVVEATPTVQLRLLAEFEGERRLLEEAIAERLGRPGDDLFCLMTARITTSVLELLGTTAPGEDDEDADLDNDAAIEHAMGRLSYLLEQLRREPPVLPRLDT